MCSEAKAAQLDDRNFVKLSLRDLKNMPLFGSNKTHTDEKRVVYKVTRGTRTSIRQRRLRAQGQTAADGGQSPEGTAQNSSQSSVEIVDVLEATGGAGNRPTVGSASCVDLTASADEEFVDLTTVNDSPIVILNSPPDVAQPGRRRPPSWPGLAINLEELEEDLASDSDTDSDPVQVLENQPREHLVQGAEGVPTTSNQGNEIFSPPSGRIVTCPICLDSDRQIRRDGRNLMSTTCGHIFCNECIRAAIDNQKKCPTCRKKLSHKQTHAIFI